MENPIIGESYKEIKKKAKKSYDEIISIHCPALSDSVVFDNVGFQHLIRKGSQLRPKSEQKRRFDLLKHAPGILSDPNTIFSHELKENNASVVDIWAFKAIIDDIHVKVVVRQIGKGKKHFLSIYGNQRN